MLSQMRRGRMSSMQVSPHTASQICEWLWPRRRWPLHAVATTITTGARRRVHNAHADTAPADAATAVAASVTANTAPAVIAGTTAAIPTSAIAAAVADGSPALVPCHKGRSMA